ncbi:MAG: endonuclease/exonuclease/phosphatase family protein [Bacteroidota bacterium]
MFTYMVTVLRLKELKKWTVASITNYILIRKVELRMKSYVGIFFLCLLSGLLPGQITILIDGSFEDWENIEPIFTDDSGDGQSNGIDIKRIWAYNDQNNIYFRFELGKEINLQEDNDLAIYVDYDNNINTGFKINGVGAELRYFFGERFGTIEEGSDMEFVNFAPVGLVVSPTVSSSEFEVSFSRSIAEFGVNFEAESTISIRIEDNGFNGDEAPNDLGGMQFNLDLSNQAEYPEVIWDRPTSTEFRLMTYNIENDQLFDPTRRNAFRRIFQAASPDVIAFQEIRDFSSAQTRDIIEDFLPGQTWFHQKHSGNVVTLSKFPINFSESIDGNAAFYLDINGEEILLINCHLPCCENNFGRQQEVDAIMEYIRELKDGSSNYDVEEGTPILIVGDMNFVGNSNQPHTFRTGDIFNNGAFGEDFAPDWDDTELLDANPYASNTFGTFTWLNPNGSFYPGKLDWIFYTDSELSLENTYSIYTPALDFNTLIDRNLQAGDVISAADHLPVIADFSFSIVDVDDLVSLDVQIYPNPTSDHLYIRSEEQIIERVKVLSQDGRVLILKNLNEDFNYFVEVADLPSGSYYILLETKEGRVVKPFFKVR